MAFSTKNTSISSANESKDDDILKNHVKELLKSRIFLGRYLERRLVEDIGYRDVVLISAAEVELIKHLTETKRTIMSFNKYQWIGITDSNELCYSRSGICIWTEIEYEPFGPFWFQIKTVAFRDKEVLIKVKCLRHISDSFLELEPLLTQGVSADENVKQDIIPSINQESLKDFVDNLKSLFTFQNIKDIITFIFAFITVIFTGGIEFVYFLGNFILALLRESSILVNNATPMFLGFLDFCSKLVGGFYILLAIIFRQNAPPPVSNRRQIKYYPEYNQQHQREFD